MTNDIVALIDFYEKEKGIDRDKVVEALENAFLSAYRKMVPGAEDIEELRARIDTKKGHTTIYANLRVVADDDHQDKFNEVPVTLAQKRNPEAQLDDKVEFNVTPKNFGRIAVQTAKQTMMQRLRQAEKEMIYDEFKDRAGDIVSGSVRRFEKNDVMIDLGKFEARMPSRERVSTEDYNIGDRIRAYVVSVDNEFRGPEIILSRSHPNFVRRLFEAEVSEISDRTVELRGVAREAGYRTKVAVWSNDEKVDPVGACVGLRGARVKNIVRELNNEKVDIIRWSDDVNEFVTDALKPATIRSIALDEENKVVNVTVDEEDLSKAIGRRGQNARLTSKLGRLGRAGPQGRESARTVRGPRFGRCREPRWCAWDRTPHRGQVVPGWRRDTGVGGADAPRLHRGGGGARGRGREGDFAEGPRRDWRGGRREHGACRR